MALDSQFVDLMNATITVENVQASSSGGYGGRSFAAAQNVKARIEQLLAKVQSHDGQEVTTRGRIFALGVDSSTSGPVAVTITPSSRLTIPAGYIVATTTQPKILNVEQFNDENGQVAYYEVLV